MIAAIGRHPADTFDGHMSQTADEALQAALDREATTHESAADRCRRDRRAVWLRLHEEYGYTQARLAVLTGYGQTTLFTELRRARAERNGDG